MWGPAVEPGRGKGGDTRDPPASSPAVGRGRFDAPALAAALLRAPPRGRHLISHAEAQDKETGGRAGGDTGGDAFDAGSSPAELAAAGRLTRAVACMVRAVHARGASSHAGDGQRVRWHVVVAGA